MKRRWIAAILLAMGMCLMMGCQSKEMEEDGDRTTDAALTSTGSQETEPKETYGPSDIRTRVPEVGETYYTEQVIEESKEEALALTQEILNNPGKVFVLGEG